MRKVILIFLITWGPFSLLVAMEYGTGRSFRLDFVMIVFGSLYLYTLKKEIGK